MFLRRNSLKFHFKIAVLETPGRRTNLEHGSKILSPVQSNCLVAARLAQVLTRPRDVVGQLS